MKLQHYLFLLPAVGILVFILFFSTKGPSFPCEKARTKNEKLICKSSKLSELDYELGKLYTQLIESLGVRQASQLRKSQSAWLKKRDAKCSDIHCLEKKYKERIAELKNYDKADGGWYEKLTKIVSSFWREKKNANVDLDGATLPNSKVGREIPIPKNYSVIATASGDLDKDGLEELVAVYNTGKPIEISDNVPRELIIYKLKNGKWTQWQKSSQVIYGSQEGGVWGDPFESIQIKKGVLIISHYGGSNWRWGFTDKFRFQNGQFYLIGYTRLSEHLFCGEKTEVDFNLVTGKMIVNVEYSKCEENGGATIYKREKELLFVKGLKITLQSRKEKEIKIKTPKYGHTIYL